MSETKIADQSTPPSHEPDRSLWQVAVYIEDGREAELAQVLSDLGYDVYRAWKVQS